MLGKQLIRVGVITKIIVKNRQPIERHRYAAIYKYIYRDVFVHIIKNVHIID